MKLAAIIFFLSISAFAADLPLKDFQWTLTDVLSKGLTKETLFSRMDRSFIRTKSSICSNRALMWGNNFKREYNLDTAKIFLFYTKKKSSLSLRTWWYHVAPVINENGSEWVVDGGFPGYITRPMTKIEWLSKFSSSANCKEINASETDLVQMIFNGQVFPADTVYGHYDCYYKVAPHTIWTPEILAQNILGLDQKGTPVRVERFEVDKVELYQACVEATSTKLGYAFGESKKLCEEYVATSH
jgi:hypothetical protein